MLKKNKNPPGPEVHIDLDRRFVDYDGIYAGEPEHSLRGFALWDGGKDWGQILEQPCTVIIAEAGNGKTQELKHQAHSLRERGEAAFFCDLSLLAKLPLHQAISPSSSTSAAADLAAWQQGNAHGYFFLDAVDEAKLADPRDFEIAIAQYLEAVEAHKSRITTVISTRPHAWRAYADREVLATRLSVPPRSKAGSTGTTEREEGASPAPPATKSGGEDPATQIAIVQLAPLDESRIRTFARASGIAEADLDSFIGAIERADADLFATRPADLPALIKIWKAEKRIGSYTEVVAGNIGLKLSETNWVHLHASPIAPDRALAGAEMLAAAATFAKRKPILVPDQPISEELRAQALDPAQVLRGWTPDEIEALLGRALFDESLYGTVRFHHRTAREFLTASWLKLCLENRKNRRSIEALLFATPYGKAEPVVIPSMKPIVGWLAREDQRIRDVALRIDPKVLLEYGDATALDIDTRAQLLVEFSRRYADRKHTPLSLDIREVRRLADERLAPLLCELLSQYRMHDDVRHLILRIIREGAVTGCNDDVLPFALDDSMDYYTQACAIEVIGISGSQDQKEQLAESILSRAGALAPQVLAAAIETLWPAALAIEDISTILERAQPPEPYSSSALDAELDRLAVRLVDREQRLSLLRAIVALLKRKPFRDQYHPISQRYAWLLPFAGSLAFSMTDVSPLDPEVLAALAMSARAGSLHRYVRDVDEKARQVLTANRSIRHELFWYLIDERRVDTGNEVNWWIARITPGVAEFDAEDFDHFVDAILTRPSDGDRKIALSVAAAIYLQQGRPAELLGRLESAVAGDTRFEAELNQHLNPPPPSAEVSESLAEHAAWEEQHKQERRNAEESRSAWVARMRANPSQVGDLSTAADGTVWNNTVWLADEIRNKDGHRWTADEWERLEPEFGAEVARAFRDFCLAFWPLYRPQLRSEVGHDTSSIPWAVIIGLGGLAMDARGDPAWAQKLSASKAALATRYALWELNGLPAWFADLWNAHGATVAEVLINELRWELSTPRSQAGSGYILSKLRWGEKELGRALWPDLIALIEQSGSPDASTMADALTVILSDGRPLPATLGTLARSRAEAATDEALKSVWFAAGLCINAYTTLSELEKWVDEGSTPAVGEQRLTAVIEHVWGDRHESFSSEHKDYLKPELLLRLLKLTHRHVRVEDDTSADGWVTPRHSAQDVRKRLLELLLSIPGKATYQALLELADFHGSGYLRDRMLVLAERHAESDVEPLPWSAGDVARFAYEAEREPVNEAELFRLALSRLDDLKLDLEDGDESEASLLRKVEDEPELRRAVANRLRQAANFKYTTGSEEELADKSRTDIRLHHPRVQERVPIEIKIAGKWTYNELTERLANQLAGQYLRAARRGIFLMINCGREVDRKKWKIGKHFVGFGGLIEALKVEAATLLAGAATVEGLEVVGVDLVRREERAEMASRPAKKRQLAPKRAAKSAKPPEPTPKKKVPKAKGRAKPRARK